MTTILKFSSVLFFTGAASLSGLEIDLRYHYDTSGFFDRPGAREAMRACADFFEEIIVDEFTEIDAAATGREENSWAARPLHPSSGERLVLENLIVPANTIIIYLGARDLGGNTTGSASTGLRRGGFQPFFDLVKSRGQEGAVADPATDYAPWGGSISFDLWKPDGTPRAWNFSLSEPAMERTDFVGVAMHELCHLLGIGIADSWDAQSVDDVFQGDASRVANGDASPLLQSGGGHWIGEPPGPLESRVFGHFGNSHGSDQRALMVPISPQDPAALRTITDLEIAALIDIGWELALPLRPAAQLNPQTGVVQFEIPTTSNFTYQLQRGNGLQIFTSLGTPLVGQGDVQILTSSAYEVERAFFRIVARQQSPAARNKKAGNSKAQKLDVIQSETYHREVKNCCVNH